MYIKKTFPLKRILIWTWKPLILFVFISLVPVSLYTGFDLHFLNLPWLPIAVLGTSVAFIIGFTNNKCYDRLWEARKIWGGIVNSSRSFAMMVNDFISNENVRDRNHLLSPEEIAGVKSDLIHRHIAWLTAHRFALRKHMPWERAMVAKSNIRFMKNNPIHERRMPMEEALKPYISNDELEQVMHSSNPARALLSKQSSELEKLYHKGLIWRFSYLEMKKMLVELITLQGKNERIKNFPYPRQFASMNFFLVRIFIVLLPFGVMTPFQEMGQKLVDYYNKEGVYSGMAYAVADNFIWLSIPFCTIISWVFGTIARVGEVSENPFEGTANDVPITTMSRAIEIDMKETIGLDKSLIPEPIQPIEDILL